VSIQESRHSLLELFWALLSGIGAHLEVLRSRELQPDFREVRHQRVLSYETVCLQPTPSPSDRWLRNPATSRAPCRCVWSLPSFQTAIFCEHPSSDSLPLRKATTE
jgi:hypothetical protein